MRTADSTKSARNDLPRPLRVSRARPGTGPVPSRTQPHTIVHPRSGKGTAAPLLALLLIGLVMAVYGQVHEFTFVFIDDKEYIYNNPIVKTGLTWQGIVWAFRSVGYANNWHPLTWLSHMTDIQFFGLNPGAHHLVNVAFHATNTTVLFLLLRAMTGFQLRSAFVAALFAVHPLHVESVAWVAERKDVLSALFWLLAVWAYLRFARCPGASKYLVAILAFTFGLLAKPMVVTLPFVLLLFDYWPLGRLSRKRSGALPGGQLRIVVRLVAEKAPFFALAAGSSLMTWYAQANVRSTLESLPFWSRVANALVAYVTYLEQAIWPFRLAIFYPHPGRTVDLRIAAFALACISGATIFMLRSPRPYLRTGWLWYLGTLVPVIGLVQVGPQAMADRYTYLPLLGIFILAVWTAGDLLRDSKHEWALLPTGLVLVALLSLVAWRQAGSWRDNLSLYSQAIEARPSSWMGHSNLAAALEDRGRIEEAINHYQEAIRIRPEFSPAHSNLGLVLLSRGRSAEALWHFSEAVRFSPRNVRMLTNYGAALADAGRPLEAASQFKRALSLAPQDQGARQELSRLSRLGSSYLPGAR